MIFGAIKNRIIAGLLALLALAALAIKYLQQRKIFLKQEVDTLEHNAEVQDQMHTVDIERIRFEAANKVRVAQVNDESTLDKLDKARGKVDENNPDFSAIKR
jgi:hypothetical protein